MRVRLLCAGGLVGLALTVSGCDPLDQNELRQEVGTIHSVAAEGALVAKGVAQDRTKATFARVQARQLSDTAYSRAEKLQDGTKSPEIRSRVERAITLATQVSSALGDLELSPRDQQQAEVTRRKLKALADRSQRFEDSL
jgi:hypothetical protein